jgi:hypothetical protein
MLNRNISAAGFYPKRKVVESRKEATGTKLRPEEFRNRGQQLTRVGVLGLAQNLPPKSERILVI